MSMVGPRREAVRIIRKLCRYGYQAPSSSDFQGRLRRNVRGEGRRSTKADAWNATLIAILTTQQPSGPESRPAQVLRSGVLTWHKIKIDPRIITREIQGCPLYFKWPPAVQYLYTIIQVKIWSLVSG